MKRLIIKFSIIFLIITGSSFIHHKESLAFSPQVIQHGATGEDVVELQARLQYLGFYNSQIDGVFGWGTYWALRNFQYEFGMDIDGLAGDQVKDMLIDRSEYHKDFVREHLEAGRQFTHYGGMELEHQVKYDSTRKQGAKQEPQQEQQSQQGEEQERQQGQPEDEQQADQDHQEARSDQEQDLPQPTQETEDQPASEEELSEEAPIEPTSVNVPNGFSQNDMELMAQAVYGEARGEPYEGQVAVAAVILNRLQSPIFPSTVSSIIYEPLAFTAVADGQIYLTPDETARRAVQDAINGWDPTGEAIYYFNPDTATSSWIWSRPQIKRIGKHIFCH